MHTLTQWLRTASVNPEMPHGLIYLSMYVCWAFSLVMSLLYYLPLLPTSIRTTSVRQNTTGGYVPVHLQIKYNWKKSSFMVWVHFCVYTGPKSWESRSTNETQFNQKYREGEDVEREVKRGERMRMMYFSAESEFTFR